MFSIGNTTLAIYNVLPNSYKFLTLFGNPTTLTQVHIHALLHADSPADRGPSPPDIPLMHPLGRQHPRETPKVGVLCAAPHCQPSCASCPLQPNPYIISCAQSAVTCQGRWGTDGTGARHKSPWAPWVRAASSATPYNVAEMTFTPFSGHRCCLAIQSLKKRLEIFFCMEQVVTTRHYYTLKYSRALKSHEKLFPCLFYSWFSNGEDC